MHLKQQLEGGNRNPSVNEFQNVFVSNRKSNTDSVAKPYGNPTVSTVMSELEQQSPPMYRGNDSDRHNIQEESWIELDADGSSRRHLA